MIAAAGATEDKLAEGFRRRCGVLPQVYTDEDLPMTSWQRVSVGDAAAAPQHRRPPSTRSGMLKLAGFRTREAGPAGPSPDGAGIEVAHNDLDHLLSQGFYQQPRDVFVGQQSQTHALSG